LKIAADHFPETRVIATGSSTLEASAKFRDTLTGRRETVWLTPMIAADLVASREPSRRSGAFIPAGRTTSCRRTSTLHTRGVGMGSRSSTFRSST